MATPSRILAGKTHGQQGTVRRVAKNRTWPSMDAHTHTVSNRGKLLQVGALTVDVEVLRNSF